MAMRILHVVGNMNRGGVETWLMHVLRHIDREHFQMDFLVHTTEACAYDDEIRALGSQTIPCLYTSPPWRYAHNLRQVLKMYGPYDIVHSHIQHYTGYVLFLSHLFGIPIRIAHSHNDTTTVQAKASFPRRIYLFSMKQLIRRNATLGLAASAKAAVSLFGEEWRSDPRWRLLHYGVQLGPFHDEVDAAAVRAEFNIPKDAFVIGHVGRFAPQKNHVFLVDIVAEVARRYSPTYLLLVGDGALRQYIAQKVAEAGLAECTIFAGLRADVPRLMRGAMDMFLFPSLHEGLPLVLLEVQASGLPCVHADVITEEVVVIAPLLRRLSLTQPASVWAESILEMRERSLSVTQAEALTTLTNSPFNVQTTIEGLERAYCVAENVA